MQGQGIFKIGKDSDVHNFKGVFELLEEQVSDFTVNEKEDLLFLADEADFLTILGLGVTRVDAGVAD